MERRIVNPWTWQDQFGFVQANETSGAERVLLCSGQTSVAADGQPLHEGDMGAQVAQAFDNLETVLSEAGFALADVVRLNYYVTDVDAFIQAGEVYGARLAQAGCAPSVHVARGVAARVPVPAGRSRGHRCEVAPRPHLPTRADIAWVAEPPRRTARADRLETT